MPLEDLKREALKLSLDDREDLAYSLLRSLDEEEEDVDPNHARLWREEIERRYREYEQGTAQTFDADPLTAPVIYGRYRRMGLEQFKHSIVYSVEAHKIVVVAVQHDRRDPGYWKRRI